jgi:hypothetical protein
VTEHKRIVGIDDGDAYSPAFVVDRQATNLVLIIDKDDGDTCDVVLQGSRVDFAEDLDDEANEALWVDTAAAATNLGTNALTNHVVGAPALNAWPTYRLKVHHGNIAVPSIITHWYIQQVEG